MKKNKIGFICILLIFIVIIFIEYFEKNNYYNKKLFFRYQDSEISTNMNTQEDNNGDLEKYEESDVNNTNTVKDFETSQDNGDLITISNWNGMKSIYSLGRVNLIKDADVNYSECNVFFFTQQSLESLFNNNPDYLKTIEFYDEMLIHKAKLFYSNNNYYVVYETGKKNMYCATVCFSRYEINNSISYVPTAYFIAMNDGSLEYYKEEGIDIGEVVFEKYTFDDLKEFYTRMDSEFYTIDEENKCVSVSGYDVKSQMLVNNIIVIDYANHQVSGLNENGDYIEIIH